MPKELQAGASLSSVSNALRLIKLLYQTDGVRVVDVARELGVAASTAHRLLATLQAERFARQPAGTRKYVAGTELVRIAGQTHASRSLESVARPHLERLSQTLRETVNLQVLSGTDSFFLCVVEGSQPLRVVLRTGSRNPAYASAGGKVLLAQLSDEEVTSMFPASFAPKTSRTVATRAELLRSLAQIRAQGFALNEGEIDQDVHALAVPVTDNMGHALAAIAVAAPITRSPKDRLQEILPAVQVTSATISDQYVGSR